MCYVRERTIHRLYIFRKSECGPYLPKRAHDLAKFHSLINDTSSAVKFIRINSEESCLEGNDILTEKGLIGNQGHLKVLEIPQEAVVCPKHRYPMVSTIDHQESAVIHYMMEGTTLEKRRMNHHLIQSFN